MDTTSSQKGPEPSEINGEKRRHERVPFPFTVQVLEFDQANLRDIGAALRQAQASIIPEENMLRFEHGNAWRSKPIDFSDDRGELELHSSEQSIHFSDIVEHELSLFRTFKTQLVQSMLTQFMASMYQKVSQGAERVGNTVDARTKPNMAEAYLAVLEKITFGVDRNGNVSFPQLHASQEAMTRFQRDIAEMSPSLRQRIEETIARKSDEALRAEAARIGKYSA